MRRLCGRSDRCRGLPRSTHDHKGGEDGEPRRPTKPVPAGSEDQAEAVRARRRRVSSSAPRSITDSGVTVPSARSPGSWASEPTQFAQRAADRDAEHALAAAQQVDDLLGGGALVDRGAVGEQRDPGQVLDAAGAQVSTAARMFCSETPVSSSRLTTLSTRMSLNE